MLRVVIVDHEECAREAVKHLLRPHADIEVAAECADGESAVSSILHHAPHIVFLEVDIPAPNGFEVLNAVHPQHHPVVIFVTANDQYAVQAFEAGALDFIVKPFNEFRFQKALDRARERAEAEPANVVQEIKALVNGTKSSVHRLALKSQGRIVLVELGEIRWIEAAGNYLRVHVQAEGTLLVRSTLRDFEARLDIHQFVRIHRSLIVNREYVKELKPWYSGEYSVVMDDGKELTLSRSYRSRVTRLTTAQ
ncbi:MAG TPA: LytTR family DNA-binding domain-containing protein [Terriglobia bacterium]|nr:LytTR family DNA-binding domain-containing protein [Terriglobia bacterium]